MGVVRLAVGSVVVALLAAHQLSTLGPGQRDALRAGWRSLSGAAPPPSPVVLPAAPPVVIAQAPMPGGDEAIAPDRLGQFQTTIEIDGQRLPAMVDTGASYLVLAAGDADRIGVRPLPSDYKIPVETANGHVLVARVKLSSVRLGSIELRDVTALVSDRGQLDRTLLGMSFLSRLSSVKMDHGRLLLSR